MNNQDTSTSSSGGAKKRRSTENGPVHIFGAGALADMDRLCMNELFSDVSFLVEDELLPAHRLILAARCEHFRKMFDGGMAESQKRQIRLNVPLKAFKVILGYFYSGKLTVDTLDEDAIFEVLGLSISFGLHELESALAIQLHESLSVGNVCSILNNAVLVNHAQLTMNCLQFMDQIAKVLVKHDSFLLLSKESLEALLPRNTFAEDELNIFQALHNWSRHNQSVDIKSLVSLVRLPLIAVKDLVGAVRKSGIVESETILEAIDKAIESCNLPYRACARVGVDVANGASRLLVTMNEMVLNLGCCSIINTIFACSLGSTLVLKYSYDVEVSCNMKHWAAVGKLIFPSYATTMQIRFAPMPVRFIRISQPDRGRKDILKEVFLIATLLNRNVGTPK
ncbi:BTB/POZ domain-containing protein 9-like [Drosophila subobscura]|uniref:BTB/POZ domain-containing protein 9-like n=1 Tax=Drosophila subobscura TaxID=7241 RepID=UPI00155AFD35|nr:BTB/POZ domain-containing protein 9-like [Drosophila subobscura]